MRVSLAGSALLATGSAAALLSGCDRQPATALGYRVLRAGDLPLLRKLLAAALDGTLPVGAAEQESALTAVLASLDRLLYETSPAVRGVFLPVLDLLSVGIMRGPVFGLWSSWDQASVADADDVLQRLAGSRTGILRGIYNGLTTFISLAWYLDPPHHAATGYPGPPRKIVG